ncbi:hypothetical protein X777_07346 [Ooceraea biroi]|uniref:Uncharacterized protein n=1 Tax=Ooceraea biroi TaxID=2015173 RepID=A0A026X136_OOCBI|nr:hypothetical protein X777_07346 [Ooceraea biroi]
MYSASTSPGGGGGQGGGGGGEVTLRLREPEDIPEEVLARLEDTATLSISLQSDAVLRLGAAGTGLTRRIVPDIRSTDTHSILTGVSLHSKILSHR